MSATDGSCRLSRKIPIWKLNEALADHRPFIHHVNIRKWLTSNRA